MKLIITESLAEARKFAEVLNSRLKKQGYFQGEEYSVTWIDEKARETGDEQNLLIPFVFKNRENPQIEIIQTLMHQCEGFIAATGAGFEGERKFREIYDITKCELPFKRLWLNQLTPKAILNAMDNLWEESKFHPIYEKQNQENANKFESDIYYFICNEYYKSRNQKPQTFYKIELQFRKELTAIKSTSEKSWTNEIEAKQVLESIRRRQKIMINSVNYEEISIAAPLLFNLTDIQILCNKELGFSAAETFIILKELYLKGLITYPETNTNKIKPSMQFAIANIIDTFNYIESLKEFSENLKWKRNLKNIIGDEDDLFQGIMPTGKIPCDLNKSQQAVYNRISIRLMESISESYRYKSMNLEINVLHHKFKTKAIMVKEAGWKAIQNSFHEGTSEILHHLPNFKKDENIFISDARIIKIESIPQSIKESALLEKFNGKENPSEFTIALESLIRKGKIRREHGQIIPVL